jgi:type II restriction enzyme
MPTGNLKFLDVIEVPYIRASHNRTIKGGNVVYVKNHLVNSTEIPAAVSTGSRPIAEVKSLLIPGQADINIRSGQVSQAEEEIMTMMRSAFSLPVKSILHSVDNPLPENEAFLSRLEGYMRAHHALHSGNFSKERFEDAVERIYPILKVNSQKEDPGHPGADVVVDGVRWSLKSEGGQRISENEVFISKFMELGRQTWKRAIDLDKTKEAFFEHMEDYDRILVLRCLTPRSRDAKTYELVEIPKEVLHRAKGVRNRLSKNTKANPPPGYCTVKTGKEIDFELGFTGGNAKKLQILKLRKELCVVHARWEFSV